MADTVFEKATKEQFISKLIEITKQSPKLWTYLDNDIHDTFKATLNEVTVCCYADYVDVNGERIQDCSGLEELYFVVTESVVMNSSWYSDCMTFLKDYNVSL